MQADQVSPYPAVEGQHVSEPQYHTTDPSLEGLSKDSPGSGKKKSVIGKVKDKAKKLKTKIKKPKSGGATNGDDTSSDSSSEGEEGSDPSEQEHAGGVLASSGGNETHGLRDSTYEATPDLNTAPAAVGMHDQFGKLNLGASDRLREEIPSAPGQVSAGVTPYLAAHDLDQRPTGVTPYLAAHDLDERPILKPSEGIDKNEGMDYEMPGGVDKSTTSLTDVSDKRDSEGKPLKDKLYDNVAAAGAGATGALGVKSLTGESEEQTKSPTTEKKGMLEQAREKIFGTKRSISEGSLPHEVRTTEEKPVDVESKSPTLTGRAAGTVLGLKDTLASKLGYGVKTPGSESETSGPHSLDDKVELPENTVGKDDNQQPKSYIQKVQETAFGAKDAVASKLGYNSAASSETIPGEHTKDQKSYVQKAQETALGAKDAVASKLGYNSGASSETIPGEHTKDQKSYVQKAQETALGAKDTVASKLGYGDTTSNKDLPTSDRADNVTVPSRFHPGDEDRALSELITEKMSTSAATVKDTLLRPFSSKSSPSTPTTTPPPSSAETLGVSDTVTQTRDVPMEGHATGEEKPAGIVGRMTGAVSSLLGTGKKNADPLHAPNEASGKSLEDPAAGKTVEGPVPVTNVEIH